MKKSEWLTALICGFLTAGIVWGICKTWFVSSSSDVKTDVIHDNTGAALLRGPEDAIASAQVWLHLNKLQPAIKGAVRSVQLAELQCNHGEAPVIFAPGELAHCHSDRTICLRRTTAIVFPEAVWHEAWHAYSIKLREDGFSLSNRLAAVNGYYPLTDAIGVYRPEEKDDEEMARLVTEALSFLNGRRSWFDKASLDLPTLERLRIAKECGFLSEEDYWRLINK